MRPTPGDMRRKTGFAADHEAHATRLAWWASFVVMVGLIAILGMASSAQALTLPIPGAPSLPVASVEDEEECETDAECEEELAGEECEEAEDEEGECEETSGVEAPVECRLSSASATVSTDPAHDKIHLLVHYSTFSPTSVSVSYFLRGSKGHLALGESKVHFAKKGSFNQTKTLTGPQMAKVLAAKDFTVQLRPAGAPSSCDHLLDRHLTIRHAAGSGFTWSSHQA
jgi:hypothetical protein